MKYLGSTFSVGGYSKVYSEKYADVFGDRLQPGDCERCRGRGRCAATECTDCGGTGKTAWKPADRRTA